MARRKKEREVLSYEDKPLEGYEDGEKIQWSRVLTGKGKAIAIILLVCVVAVAGVAAWSFIAPDKIGGSLANGEAGTGYPSKIEGTNIPKGNTALVSGKFSYVSDTSYVVLNDTGGFAANDQLKYAAPALSAKGNNAIVYNQQDKGFQIHQNAQMIYESEATYPIVTAAVATNGDYALIMQSEGYASQLEVYDTENNKKFGYKFSQYYITAVSLNENGKSAVVSGVSSIEGELISVVYVLDFTKEEPLVMHEFPQNLIMSVDFLNNGKIAVVGDKSAAIITADYQMVNTFDYDDEVLTASVVDPYNGIVLSLSPSGDGRNCVLRYISSSGSEVKAETDLQILDVANYGESIVALSKGQLVKFNHNAEKIGAWEVGTDAQAIVLQSEQTAYILGISEIRIEQLK